MKWQKLREGLTAQEVLDRSLRVLKVWEEPLKGKRLKHESSLITTLEKHPADVTAVRAIGRAR